MADPTDGSGAPDQPYWLTGPGGTVDGVRLARAVCVAPATAVPYAIVAALLFAEFLDLDVSVRPFGSSVVIDGSPGLREAVTERLAAVLAEDRFTGWQAEPGRA